MSPTIARMTFGSFSFGLAGVVGTPIASVLWFVAGTLWFLSAWMNRQPD